MPEEETTTLKASCQYNDYQGNATADTPMNLNGSIFQVEDGHKVIGWKVGKCSYDGPVRVKLLSAHEQYFDGETLSPNARIKVKELDMNADAFIKALGRFEILLLNQLHNDFIGETFVFEHED